LAERYRDELRAEIPEIDAVLGTGEVPEIVGAITGATVGHKTNAAPMTFYRSSSTSQKAADGRREAPGTLHAAPGTRHLAPGTSPAAPGTEHPALGTRHPAPTYIYDADTPRLLATPKHYAYLKVAEGCDYKCAFCIIPTLRGPYRSRSADSIEQ